jgi:hypothetical protein
MNELHLRRLKFYDDNYDTVVFNHLDAPRKIEIASIKTGQCRYCKKASPNAKFTKEAHAFPQMIGNDILMSSDECDDCNKFFSETIEDNLAKFLGIQRTIALTKGKNGVPSYKSPNKQVRWDVDRDGKIAISSVIGDDSVAIDQENKKLTVRTIRQPHIRRSAYKCFVKMALSLMSESDLGNMAETIDWILQRDDKIQTKSFVALQTFVSGAVGFRHITFALLRRKPLIENVPQYSFFIAWGRFTYQVFLPFASGDKALLGKTMTLEYFPNVLDCSSVDSKVAYAQIDMSSNDLIRNDVDTVTYSFEEITETKLKTSANGP